MRYKVYIPQYLWDYILGGTHGVPRSTTLRALGRAERYLENIPDDERSQQPRKDDTFTFRRVYVLDGLAVRLRLEVNDVEAEHGALDVEFVEVTAVPSL